MILLHMGALHPLEQALVLILAFGPFVLLGLVVWLRRRAERREDAQAESGRSESIQAGSIQPGASPSDGAPAESAQTER